RQRWSTSQLTRLRTLDEPVHSTGTVGGTVVEEPRHDRRRQSGHHEQGASMSDVPAVNHNPEESRYEITVDGQLAGFSQYLDTETEGTAQRILFHTEVGKAFGGRGLASTLTREAIGQAVSEGKRVVPMCSYVQKWVETHDDHADHIDAVTPEHEALFGAGSCPPGQRPTRPAARRIQLRLGGLPMVRVTGLQGVQPVSQGAGREHLGAVLAQAGPYSSAAAHVVVQQHLESLRR